MSFLRKLLVATLLICSGSLAAATSSDSYQFNQDRMLLTNSNIMIVSSFENSDCITAYSDLGTRQWNIVFYPKILSWNIKDGYLFVFSKARYAEVTHLTCIDPVTGTIIWERP